MVARTVTVRIQHTSLQFSDSKAQHVHDVNKIFTRAVDRSIWACSGTEAGGGDNHDLRDALIRSAHVHDFFLNSNPNGEWVALNKRFLTNFDQGFAGPFVPAEGGKGGHSARGVVWASGKALHGHLGRLCFGSCHYLTDRSEEKNNQTNLAIVKGIGAWGRTHGKGSGVVFIGADANTNDRTQDVFMGRPFTTIADELKKWPATHGANVIDVIASYDHDGRVVARAYQVYSDKEFSLYTDHNLLHAVYEITENG
jgi:hypothetical protein